jgi:hypothetical protein
MTSSYSGPQDKFTLFSNVLHSNLEGKEGQMWAKAEWPIDQILAFANWATNEAEKVQNQKGEQCVVVQQKFLPKVAQASGNPYFLGIISDPKPRQQPRFDANEEL